MGEFDFNALSQGCSLAAPGSCSPFPTLAKIFGNCCRLMGYMQLLLYFDVFIFVVWLWLDLITRNLFGMLCIFNDDVFPRNGCNSLHMVAIPIRAY